MTGGNLVAGLALVLLGLAGVLNLTALFGSTGAPTREALQRITRVLDRQPAGAVQAVDGEALRFVVKQVAEERLQSALEQARATSEAAADRTRRRHAEGRAAALAASFAPPPVSTSAGSTTTPNNVSRLDTLYDTCGCGSGLSFVTVWPEDNQSDTVSVRLGAVGWVRWNRPVHKVVWTCDGMDYSVKTTVDLPASRWLSLQLQSGNDTDFFRRCHRRTGRLKWNTWEGTDYLSSIPFTTATDGYACIKIPALLRTNKGTVIAFAEGRTPDCDDFAQTDLIYKRSTDGGRTWSDVQVLVRVNDAEREALGMCGHQLVIGNIAPVQLRQDSLRHPGRILAPYTRNNFRVWITYSDDDGATWSPDQEIPNVTNTAAEPDCDRNMTYFGYDVDAFKLQDILSWLAFVEFLCHSAKDPYESPDWASKLAGPWQFLAVGPPGSLQLRSGRVLVPAYHSYIRGLPAGDGILPVSQLYNNFAVGHSLISDDGGDTWTLGDEWPAGQGANENQVVELADGTVLTNSRSLSTGSPQFRVQSCSKDNGTSWQASTFTDIPQPFNGCQGSIVVGPADTVFVSSPDPPQASTALQDVIDAARCHVNLTGRSGLSVWRSTDAGASFPTKLLIDAGLSAQSSMQYADGKLLMLYEQADPPPLTMTGELLKLVVGNVSVELPSRFVFREVAI